jgi:hypothetical protein
MTSVNSSARAVRIKLKPQYRHTPTLRTRLKMAARVSGITLIAIIAPALFTILNFSSYTESFASEGSVTLSSGSFIINTGVTPQTYNNGLKPYGMIYDLITNYSVEIKWVINESKAKDGTDFTYSGTAYKGGPFVIRAEDITAAIAARITYWQGQGVQGVYTTSAITVPVYATLSYFPKVIIDNTSNNQNIVIGYFTDAGLPAAAYTTGTPSQLTSCHDIWANPHGDPTLATHSYLYDFVTTQKSYIWSECHAVSVLEGLVNSSAPFQQMNYLTSSGLKCYSASKCGTMAETHGGNSTAPYSHNYSGDPVMQFMSTMDGASGGGSEQWYVPLSTGSWRATTKRLVTSADGVSPNEGVLMVYGPAYGNASNGYVMYEGGHDLDGNGSTTEKVAAVRAFFNFVLLAGLSKQMALSSFNLPSSLSANQTYNVSVVPSGGTAPYTYSWTSTAGGSFANAAVASTTFTAPNSNSATGVIKCTITDGCSRQKIISTVLTVSGTLPVSLTSFTAQQTGNDVQLNWTTASETDNDYFTIARSTDGKEFKELSKIDGAGTSAEINSYSYIDVNPFNGNSYYRLSQTDYDGTVKTFSPVHINFEKEIISPILANPVPFSNYLRVKFSSFEPGTGELSLVNRSGQVVSSKSVPVQQGENTFTFNELATLPKGIYFLQIKNGDKILQVLKVMKE